MKILFLIGTIVAIASSRVIRVARSADLDEIDRKINADLDVLSNGELERMGAAMSLIYNEDVMEQFGERMIEMGMVSQDDIDKMEALRSAYQGEQGKQ